MDIKKTLLAGISASALVVAASVGAMANGIDGSVDDNAESNDQEVDINDSNDGRGNDGFGRSNAVAVAALQQSAVQVIVSDDEEAIEEYDADMDFGSRTFQNQVLNNNNFNAGANAVQGNALAVAGTSNASVNGGGE